MCAVLGYVFSPPKKKEICILRRQFWKYVLFNFPVLVFKMRNLWTRYQLKKKHLKLNVYEPKRLPQFFWHVQFFGQIRLLVFLHDASTSIPKNHARKCVNTLQPWSYLPPSLLHAYKHAQIPFPPLSPPSSFQISPAPQPQFPTTATTFFSHFGLGVSSLSSQ